MNERSKRPLPWIAIAFHKLHASGYDTIYCKYSHLINKKGHQLLALLKKMARILESIFVDQKKRQYHPIMILYIP